MVYGVLEYENNACFVKICCAFSLNYSLQSIAVFCVPQVFKLKKSYHLITGNKRPYLLTYQTPMAGDLLLFRMKKQEIKRDDCFELKILVNEKNKHKIQTLSLLYIYIYSFAIYFNMLLQLY